MNDATTILEKPYFLGLEFVVVNYPLEALRTRLL
jgi:hypothetical protein